MSVKEIFETMEYGPALEATQEAMQWLQNHDRRFGHFINGAICEGSDHFNSRNPATGKVLAKIAQAKEQDVHNAVTSARAAQADWAAQSGHQRARVLYAIARLVQKHSRLFATLETLDNGKPIRESRDIDIPLVHRHFYYHAGMAQLMASELTNRQALGVCGQIIPWNFPLLMLAWKIAPALAMGNSVVLKPAEYTSLTALLFAEICRLAGVPNGVINIITGDGRVGEHLVNHPDIDKIAFTGSTDVGRKIRLATAGSGKKLTLELGGKSPFIVFDDADHDSAVEGLVDAIWFNQGQVCCAGSRLLVHEAVADRLHDKIRARMTKLRLGNPLDKSVDMGPLIDPAQVARVNSLVDASTKSSCFQPNINLPKQGCFYPPTLLTELSPSDPLMQKEIFGPVLVSTSFRTPQEAVQLANNTRYGLAASIWSENVNLCLGLAPALKAGVIWVNGTNMFDAAAGFGGIRESGFGREGGWEGLTAYTKPKAQTIARSLKPILAKTGTKSAAFGLDRTTKLYIGGKQTRPDSGYSTAVFDAAGDFISDVPSANRKDIRNAVEAARAAVKWSGSTGHLRAQILYFIAENLSARAAEFAEKINRYAGETNGAAEVEASLERLFTYAAWADKHDGAVRDVPLRGVALALNEPVGVIGGFCPDDAPLLGLVSLLGPALAMGNRVVLVASEPYPLIATEFYQILETSDVPAGVVNLLTGAHSELVTPLASHLNIDAIWSFSSSDLSAEIEAQSALGLKRSWVNYGQDRDWFSKDGEGKGFLAEASQSKTVWIPFGEG